MIFVRSSRSNTSKGSELTTNYIGDLILAPIGVRREVLEDQYGFLCSCARCKEEDKAVRQEETKEILN